MGRELNRWPMPACPVEEGRKEQNNLYLLHLVKNSCMTCKYASLPYECQREPSVRNPERAATSTTCAATLSTSSCGKSLLLQLNSQQIQIECEQLCLEVNSFLAAASNCLKPWDTGFDYNHSLHMFRVCLGQDRLSSFPSCLWRVGGSLWGVTDPKVRGPQRLTTDGFLFLGKSLSFTMKSNVTWYTQTDGKLTIAPDKPF